MGFCKGNIGFSLSFPKSFPHLRKVFDIFSRDYVNKDENFNFSQKTEKYYCENMFLTFCRKYGIIQKQMFAVGNLRSVIRYAAEKMGGNDERIIL